MRSLLITGGGDRQLSLYRWTSERLVKGRVKIQTSFLSPSYPAAPKTLGLKARAGERPAEQAPGRRALGAHCFPPCRPRESAMNQTSRAKVDKWSSTLETDLV